MMHLFDNYRIFVLSLGMKKLFITIFFVSISFSQSDRSTIFNTGTPPDLGVGWDITCNQFEENNIGDINNDLGVDVLDVVSIVSFILGNAIPTAEETIISDINEDTNIDVLDVIILVGMILDGSNSTNLCQEGLSAAIKFTTFVEYTFEAFSVIFETGDLQGQGLFEIHLHQDNFNTPGDILGSWELTVGENTAREYYVFTGDSDCITLEPFASYWLSVNPKNNGDEALWLLSEEEFTYSTSNDMGVNWLETSTGQVGCMKIFGEQIFETDDSEPSLETVYDWSLEDINPNSDYYFPDYGETIGPSSYVEDQQVSVYYFGKAG